MISVSELNGANHFFAHVISWRNATVPVLAGDNTWSTVSAWANSLFPYFQRFLTPTLPFKTKIVWTLEVEHLTNPRSGRLDPYGNGNSETYYHHSPPFVFTGRNTMESMKGLVALMMREYQVVLEKMTGSGFRIKSIPKVEFKEASGNEMAAFNAGTYIPSPQSLKDKGCCVNFQTDEHCFILSVLCCLRRQEKQARGEKWSSDHAGRISTYYKIGGKRKRDPNLLNELDTMGLNTDMLSSTVQMSEVEAFEEANDIGIYIYDYKDRDAKIGSVPWSCLVRAPSEVKSREVVLVILQQGNRYHFVACPNFRALKGTQSEEVKTKLPMLKGRSNRFYCYRCCQSFWDEPVLEKHLEAKKCLGAWSAPDAVLPDSPQKLEFKSYNDMLKHPCVAVYDLECATDRETGCQDQVVSAGYWVEHNQTVEINRGEDPAFWLITRLLQHAWVFLKQEPLEMVISEEQERQHKKARRCHYCNELFLKTSMRKKVKHHDHFTGQFLGSACNRCNLAMRKPKTMHCYAHNAEGYDHTPILRAIAKMRELPQYKRMRFETLQRNHERTISITFGPLQFRDSCHHMKASLGDQVETLWTPELHNFTRTCEYHPLRLFASDIIKKPDHFPYRRLGEWDVLLSDLTKEDYYNDLRERPMTEAEFKAKRAWQHKLGLKTMGDLHDAYLYSDVLTLADCWAAFRDANIKLTKLDPAWSLTLPTLAWKSLCLDIQKSGHKIEILSKKDEEIAKLLDANMIGGLCLPFQRRAEASENVHLKMFDFRNLYPSCMAEYMPVGNWIKVETKQEEALDLIRNWKEDSDKGYAMLVNHWCDPETHDSIDFAPFARVTIDIKDLSEEQQHISDMLKPLMGPRIAPSLGLHKDILLDVSVLQIYLKMGVSLLVKQVWRYDQAPVFRKWILGMHEARTKAKTEVEKQTIKLNTNGVYGKTLEDRSKRKNSRFYTDKEAWLQAAGHRSTDYFLVSQKPFLGIASRPKRKATVLDTPRYVGWCVLMRSKARMYRAWYETFKPVFGPRATLLYMDTDSLLIKILSDRLEEELKLCNKAKINLDGTMLGMLNDEAKKYRKDLDISAGEFTKYIGLAAKMYCMVFEYKKSILKARGIPGFALRSFEDYERFADEPYQAKIKFNKLIRRKQSIAMKEVTRRGVAGLDSKTFHTSEQNYPLGHWRISLKQAFDAFKTKKD